MSKTSHRLSLAKCLTLVVVGGLAFTLLVVVRTLEPDPRGYGTHEQFGLIPCYFQESTGMRCPMCGGTTAWAHVVRGELMRAAETNLGATLLCVAVAIGSPWFVWMAALRQPLPNWLTGQVVLMTASAWWAVVVLDWLRKLM